LLSASPLNDGDDDPTVIYRTTAMPRDSLVGPE
jgi:hypothetical protein